MNAASTDASIRREAIAWLARCDAGLPADGAREFAAWQAADPRHAAAVADLSGAWSVLDLPRAAGQVDWVKAGLRRRARQRQQQLGSLVAVLCLGVSLALWRPWSGGTAPLARAGSTARVVAAAQETLPDGSVAEFAPGSRIEQSFGTAERRVRLVEGEVHFDVRKDATRPFIVDAGGVAVRAVGTAFAVRLEAGNVRVIVTHGTVAVAGASGLLWVQAGRELLVPVSPTIATSIAPTVLDAVSLAERLVWRVPRLEFSETTLAEAAALFNARSGQRLAPGDAAVGALRVTGVFRADNVEGFVDLAARTLGLVAERTGDTITLWPAPGRK